MLHRGWICGHCVTPWYTVWHTVTMRDIIWGINQSSIEGMNKITYTKHCEFWGTEFTTPIHLRRYCSKSCVRAAYKMRLKEKRKSDAVKTLETSHGLMPEVCYFSVTQTASILGMSRMSVYRMIYDGRLNTYSGACSVSGRCWNSPFINWNKSQNPVPISFIILSVFKTGA